MIQVAKAKDYPVDLYFLMDLSWYISKLICMQTKLYKSPMKSIKSCSSVFLYLLHFI